MAAASADELQAKCVGKANKFLCFLPLCAVHQPHFTFITRDNVPDQRPKATAGQAAHSSIPPLFSGLMKMKAATAAATTTTMTTTTTTTTTCAYPPSNAQLKAESSIWSTRLMCRWCPLEGDPRPTPDTLKPTTTRLPLLKVIACDSTRHPTRHPSPSFSCRHRLRSVVFLSTHRERPRTLTQTHVQYPHCFYSQLSW